MLHLKTVEPYTFSILEELMELPALQNFALVGGTALSLLFGHRLSVYLDLFSHEPFENSDVVSALEKHFEGKFVNRSTNPRFGIFGFINEVKIDIIRHPHPNIRPIETHEGIRMFSVQDIIAMKVQAILGRGKKKDFWDIAELLQHFSVSDFIQFHREKFSTQNLLITVPQAITFFADAEESEDPISFNNQTWQTVQAFINKKVREYLK